MYCLDRRYLGCCYLLESGNLHARARSPRRRCTINRAEYLACRSKKFNQLYEAVAKQIIEATNNMLTADPAGAASPGPFVVGLNRKWPS